MKLLNFLKDSIRKADFFKSRDLIRYRAQSDYKTVFGGTVSILLIALLIITFQQRLFSCIRKDSINSKEETILNQIPTLHKIQSYPQGNFMLAINLRGINRTMIKKHFQISMTQILSFWMYEEDRWNSTKIKVQLQDCTPNHWGLLGFTPTEYQSWDLDNMLCVPMNSTFQFEGDELSDISKKIQIIISPCNTTIPGNTCGSQQQTDDLFNLKKKIEARLYIINSNVNPSMKEYIHYSFNYRNLLTFTSQESSEGNVFVSDYQIETDQSIIPIQTIQVQTGATLTTTIIPATHFRNNKSLPYCQFNIFKSDVSKKYNRSFDKFDELLAYIGGLFGMLSMCLVIVSSYNNFAYQISLGAALFKPQQLTEMKTFRKYNFLSYFLQMVHSFLGFLGISPDWKSTIEYNKCKEEIEKQLDIKYILDRLTYLQTATSMFLQDYQMKSLHFKGKLTLKQAKMRRRAFNIKRDIKEAQKFIETQHNIGQKARGATLPTKFMKKTSIGSKIRVNSKNQILPTFSECQSLDSNAEGIEAIDEHPAYESDSSTQDEQGSKISQDNEVLKMIDRLKEDQENGDKISKKIWEVTNSAFSNFVPENVSKITIGILNEHCEARKINNTLLPRYANINVGGISIEDSDENNNKEKLENQSLHRLTISNFTSFKVKKSQEGQKSKQTTKRNGHAVVFRDLSELVDQDV